MRLAAGMLALICLGASCQTGGANPPAPDILIGSELPMSGLLEPDGLPLVRAIRLAVLKYPTIGRFRLGYAPYDSAVAGFPTPPKGVQNVRRMIDDAQILGMVGPFETANAFEEIPVASAAALAMLSPSNTHWCLTRDNGLCNPQPAGLRRSGINNYFRIAATDPDQGRALARYVRQQLNLSRVAAFTLQGAFEDLTLDGFTKEFVRDGGDVVLAKPLPEGTVDFRPFLRDARADGAEAIFAATEEDVCAVRKQMNGIFPSSTPFMGMDRLQETDDCIQEAGPDADGMLATVSDLDPNGVEAASIRAFVTAYNNAYPHGPAITSYTLMAYDCALIMIQAITDAVTGNSGRVPTRGQVVEALAHSKFQGLIHTYKFDANGDAISPVMALYRVKGGQWIPVGQIDDSPTPA
ncbi:MAG TPA: branched-chain amino acid ABC transporter substrate-binding protein [bacterium]|nr:branched-chain amino acid ABC transporter substrate-binding protein [bacterium]